MNISKIAEQTGVPSQQIAEALEFMKAYVAPRFVMKAMEHESGKLRIDWDYTKKQITAFKLPHYEILDSENFVPVIKEPIP